MVDVRHDVAVRQVGEVLKRFANVRQLTVDELSMYKERVVKGWEIPKLCTDPNYNLRLIITGSFPFHPPRVAVSPSPAVLSWPNLEESGLLCLLPESASVSTRDPTGVVLSLLNDAQLLVNRNLDGSNLDRFEEEFSSYWNRWCEYGVPIKILCRPEGSSRWLSAWHGQHFILIAENDETLRSWLQRRYDRSHTPSSELQTVPLIWLPRPPHPSEYPENVSSLMSLLCRHSVNNRSVEQLLLHNQARHKTLVLGFFSQHGVGYAGLRINVPKTNKYAGNPLTKGFRGRPPDRVLLMRYNASQIAGIKTSRFDASWIHGRDHDRTIDVLSNKSVIVIGCGALGSTVSELMLKVGVGKITLVDYECLESENVGRHVLGVSSVGCGKAKELARSLSQRFPHLSVTGHQASYEKYIEGELDQLISADLVISTTGNWRVESHLNAICNDLKSFPPLLSSWLEPYAVVGHAIVFFKSHGCLSCIVDDLGNMRIPAAVWDKRDLLIQVPGCGGLFQPYGAVELNFVHSLVADLSLDVLLGHVNKTTHRVWLGRKKLLDSTEGKWNPAWIDRYGNPESGGTLHELDVEFDGKCPECGDIE